jgi:ligand-binding sensor domain-containing protein
VRSTLLQGFATALPVWLPGAPPGAPVAVAERAGSVLVGTDRGLYSEASGGWSRVPTRGAVRDLASVEGAVWIATDRVLYEWHAGQPEPRAVSLASGANVESVALGPDGDTWAATEVGLFRRSEGSAAFVRETSIPAGRVLGVRVAGSEVWVAARRRVWRRSPQGVFEPVVEGLDDGRWELCDAIETGEATLLCVPDGLWRVEGDRARWIELEVTRLRGLALADSTVWVASDQGLVGYPVPALEGSSAVIPRAESSIARRAGDVALVSRGVVVATAGGVARLALESQPPSEPGLWRTRPTHGEAEELRLAVLAYLALSPDRMSRVEERSSRAGLLPSVRASFGLDRERAHSDDQDEVFSSGAVRNLLDSASDRGTDVSVALQLTWELERLRDPGDALAISRERRERIELRDQVLDRVNRLYFERLRVLARLAQLPAGSGAERVELEIRERELRAGLDGWSGGAFSRLVRRPSSPAPPGSFR